MAGRFNASINTLGIEDKRAQDAIRRLLENCQYLKEESERARKDADAALERQKVFFNVKIAGLNAGIAALEARLSAAEGNG